jgi:O-antigen/teichoic acid export membrane protein
MITGSIKRLWQHFLTDNLFRNSVYLMLTTALGAALGFFFWLIVAHVFNPDEVGIGTTLISAMTLISSISLLGFNSTFIRVLPTSDNRNNQINTGSILVIITAALMAGIYILLVPYIVPKLDIVEQNGWYVAGFIVMVALASINSLTDSIFIAYRSAKYTLMTDGVVTAGTKLLLPLFFIGLGAYGVFASAGLAAALGMVASILYLIFLFGYKPEFRIDKKTLKSVFRYSFVNYIANLLSIIPTLILPIIIIDSLGAASEADYYLAFMIASLIYAISVAVSQSLFAEGSYGSSSLRKLLKDSSILLAVLTVPAALLFIFLGPIILGFFGKSYNLGGSSIVILFALAAPIVAGYNIAGSLLRIRHQINALLIMDFLYAISVIGFTIFWVGKGLEWVGIAWLAGNFIAVLFGFVVLFLNRKNPTPVVNS